jgi:hypothetical protein
VNASATRPTVASLATAVASQAEVLAAISQTLAAMQASQSAPSTQVTHAEEPLVSARPRKAPAVVTAPVKSATAAEVLDHRAAQYAAQIAAETAGTKPATAYKRPAAKLARLVACRNAADTPELALAWFLGTQPMPDALRNVDRPVKHDAKPAAKVAQATKRAAFAASWLDELAGLAKSSGSREARAIASASSRLYALIVAH